MRLRRRPVARIVLAVAGITGYASLPVRATEPVLTFGFTDLDGAFVAGSAQSGSFNAVATPTSTGGVTRVLPSLQTVRFGPNFTSAGMSDVAMSMSVTDIQATQAQSVGSITVTDFDGDTITADIRGTWSRLGNFASFSGVLSNVQFNETGDGIFEGSEDISARDAFAMDFEYEPFNGALLQFTLPSHWFSEGNFFAANSLVEASVVPLPAPVVLGALGLALVGLLRRRLSMARAIAGLAINGSGQK
jgi:hypothetical protein